MPGRRRTGSRPSNTSMSAAVYSPFRDLAGSAVLAGLATAVLDTGCGFESLAGAGVDLPEPAVKRSGWSAGFALAAALAFIGNPDTVVSTAVYHNIL